MQDENPVDRDGVPLYGGLTEFVHNATQTVINAELERMKQGGLPDLDAYRVNVKKARQAAIAQWKSEHGEEV